MFVDLSAMGQVIGNSPVDLFEREHRKRLEDGFGRVSVEKGVNN